MQKTNEKEQGFTLIEILVVIGLIALLAAIVIIAINPARQFAQGRNTQRTSNVNTILNAIGQRMADNKGVFEGTGIDGKICPTITEGATSTIVWTGAVSPAPGDFGCLVPTYISIGLDDPQGVPNYEVSKDLTTKRTTVSAPHAELSQTISVTR